MSKAEKQRQAKPPDLPHPAGAYLNALDDVLQLADLGVLARATLSRVHELRSCLARRASSPKDSVRSTDS